MTAPEMRTPGGNLASAEKITHSESTPDKKLVATLIAQFALAGHAVHKGCDSDFVVCKYAMVKYCKDLAELQAFAKQVGVTL
jgi:hypothetical protein